MSGRLTDERLAEIRDWRDEWADGDSAGHVTDALDDLLREVDALKRDLAMEEANVTAYSRFEVDAQAAEAALVSGRAQTLALREALEALDPAFQWLAENYPKALREMPTETFRGFGNARAALVASPEPPSEPGVRLTAAEAEQIREALATSWDGPTRTREKHDAALRLLAGPSEGETAT